MIIKSKISQYLILIFLMFNAVLFSQNKHKEQSIELPEFVITGVQKIKIPVMKKHKPELIPVLDNKFFKPYVSPAKLSLASFTKPQSPNIVVHKGKKYLSGQLEVGAGIYTQPAGKFLYHLNKGYAHVFANVEGINIKNYVPFSKYNSSKFKLGTDVNISHNSEFLPGTKFTVQGNYKREQYYLYGSTTPNFERKNEYYSGQLKIQNYYSKKFNFVLSGKLNNIKFYENSLEEATIKGNANFTYNWERFSVSVSGNYKTQAIKNSPVISFGNYSYGGTFRIKLNPSEDFSLSLGAAYYTQDTNKLIRPLLGLDVRLDKNLTLIVSYEPSTKFETIKDFQKQNMYLKNFDFNHLFVMNSTDFTLAIRYQYSKYFEVNGGVLYQIIENMPFFGISQNLFDLELKTSDYVRKGALFFNFLFYKGPHGYFFGNIKTQALQFRNGRNVPYQPIVKADLTYGFNITKSLQLELNAKYYSKSFVNFSNSKQIPDYINGAAEIKYSFVKNLIFNISFENLLNRNNYLFSGYKEKPFDIIAGVNYNW